jgi:hypothetical protein
MTFASGDSTRTVPHHPVGPSGTVCVDITTGADAYLSLGRAGCDDSNSAGHRPIRRISVSRSIATRQVRKTRTEDDFGEIAAGHLRYTVVPVTTHLE